MYWFFGLRSSIGDSEALAGALALYLQNPAIGAVHGAAGRERCLRLFTADRLGPEIEAVARPNVSLDELVAPARQVGGAIERGDGADRRLVGRRQQRHQPHTGAARLGGRRPAGVPLMALTATAPPATVAPAPAPRP